MGFYDCRCMATGVSLKGADAALVLLQPSAAGYDPIALAIKGSYDRLGSIDGVDEDANTRLVLRYFLDGLRSGSFTVDEEYLAVSKRFPIRTIEDLLFGFERNMNDGSGHAVLHGQPVVFALIALAVWDTIAQSVNPSGEPLLPVFHRLFGASTVGTAIYAGSLDEVSSHVVEFASVDAFLKSRGLPWLPSEGGGQHYAEEMREYLVQARRDFANSATVIAALNRYEEEVGELLENE
jgi:hypothetical protein